jgi:DNA topoisomerase-3
MESAGASWGKEVSKAMRDRGLGTPATRASTIEELISMGYIEREAKLLRVTTLGDALVRRVDGDLASPSLTGEWEAKLRRIERGELGREQVLREIEDFVTTIVKSALARGVARRRPPPAPRAPHGETGKRKGVEKSKRAGRPKASTGAGGH